MGEERDHFGHFRVEVLRVVLLDAELKKDLDSCGILAEE